MCCIANDKRFASYNIAVHVKINPDKRFFPKSFVMKDTFKMYVLPLRHLIWDGGSSS